MNQTNEKLLKKRFYFALLYFTQGAPIGFLTLALPTLFREQEISVKMIAQFSSLLVIPWSVKLIFAPFIDILKNKFFGYRGWMIFAQIMMALTLIPIMFLDLKADFRLISKLLLIHTFFTAIQDIAVDSLAITVTTPLERGKINGWMHMGQLLGTAAFGGGTLLLLKYVSLNFVITLLILSILTFGLLTANSNLLKIPKKDEAKEVNNFFSNIKGSFASKNFILGIFFTLSVFSIEKSFLGLLGPWLIDRGFDSTEIGTFLAFPALMLQLLGSLFGGYFADHFSKKKILMITQLSMIALIVLIIFIIPKTLTIPILCLLYFGTGMLISTCYSMLMNLTTLEMAATQFAAFMAMVNLSESYSVYLVGRFSPVYGSTMPYMITGAISIISFIFLYFLNEVRNDVEDEYQIRNDIPVKD